MAQVKLKQEHGLRWESPHINEEPESPNLTEEPELCVKQELEELPFHIVTVKTEDDDDQSPAEEESGAGAGPHPQLHSHSEEDTDRSEDYGPQPSPSKRSYAMIPPDSSLSNHNLFCCSLCGKSFQWSSAFHRHQLVHTGERPHRCSVCERSYKEKGDLNVHMRTHAADRPYDCSTCEKTFKYKSDLSRHLKQVHLICPVCQSHFPDKLQLDVHLSLGTHVDEGSPARAALEEGRRKGCVCSECGKRFKCQTDVRKHMSVHTGERPHTCLVCQKTFTQKGSLTMHMRTHTGERPYVCLVCGKRFSKGFNLRRHTTRNHAKKGTAL